ncbi:MAG: hypothetical protein FWC34_08470 [Bacteroidetes bacterium]|nr:hypothetical protein [Bacteroidota bacterium]
MKKIKNVLVIIGGINFLFFGLFHLTFWHGLNWGNELIKLTEINSNVMQMLNIGIVVFMLALGFIMLFYRKEILNSALGRALLIAFSLFWLARLVGEFAFPGGSIILGVILFLCVLIYLIPAIIIKK